MTRVSRSDITGVAPFGEDPYDAVGSFAVQLAGLASQLSMVRALRSRSGHARVWIRHGWAITLLAILGPPPPGWCSSSWRRGSWLEPGCPRKRMRGMEAAGILLGYACFWRFLGLGRPGVVR